tara:strand:+ start:3234 stop:3398 length:165 start_codon:yes stop_codon:yes gene_type:complete
MSLQKLERLKKDKKEAIYYRKRLMEKGKSVLAYKMEKKIAYMEQHINDMVEISK